MKENSLNKRSKIEIEISFVSSTENHLFMTRDLIHTIKTKPPNNTGTEGAIFDIRYSLPAVLIKNASVGAVLRSFLSDFANHSNASFRRKNE